jgi:hypothetical protein
MHITAKYFLQKSQAILLLFFVLFIIFFPSSSCIASWQATLSQYLFTDAVCFLSSSVFDWPMVSTLISSDSRAMYLFCLLLIMMAFLLQIIFVLFIKNSAHLQQYCYYIIVYYLVYMMWQYGWDKLTYQQFAAPEPNILFTNIGDAHKDILYWSAIGTSRGYNIFLGLVEMIASVLLMFRFTRPIGLLAVVFIMLNVLAINICFDINVKLFSAILLSMAMVCLLPYCMRVYQSIKHNMPLQAKLITQIMDTRLKNLIKYLILLGIMIQVCGKDIGAYFLFLSEKNNNDFKGAYQVINKNNQHIRRVFIHKDDYLITQNDDDKMQDYPIQLDTIIHCFVALLPNKQSMYIPFIAKNKILQTIILHQDTLRVMPINYKNMPALQPDFHATIDEY